MNDKTYNKEFFQKAGKKGGTNTAKKGKEYFQKIGKLGSEVRWSKNKPEDHHT